MPITAEPGITNEALFKALGFKPHSPAQLEYILSDARFNAPCCGRRWGKSIAAGKRMTRKMFVPDTYNWIVGPKYKLGEKEFRITYRDFEKLGLLKHCKKSYDVNGGNMRIATPWGSVLEVVSAEKPDSLLGEGLTHAIMSESARHSRATWEQYIEPALSDLRGSCDFPSTPRGYNWYHGLWLMGQDPSMVDYRSWHLPTWTNAVRYPQGENDPEIQRIKSTVSKQYFDQEYGALFTTFAGVIYDEWDDRRHVKEHAFNPTWSNYRAFDYGFANPFVCLDIQIAPDDTVWVWREYYSRFKSTYDHANILKLRENPSGYHVDGMWGDNTGADQAATIAPILGYVASEDIPWLHGVEYIKRLLREDRLFISPNCPNLRRQMNQLHVKEISDRPSTQDLKETAASGSTNIQHKVDDHAADALRYFIGPYFVNGAGAHLSDIYGTGFSGSESESFVTLHSGVTLDDGLVIGRNL